MLKFTKQPKTLGITLKNLVVSFYNTLCAHKSQVCIILQIGAIEKKCWFSAAYYRIWLEGYQIIFVRSSSLAKGQQTFKIKPVNIQSRSFRTLTKRTPADMELSIYLTFIFIATKQKQLFLHLQSMKKQLWQLFNLV